MAFAAARQFFPTTRAGKSPARSPRPPSNHCLLVVSTTDGGHKTKRWLKLGGNWGRRKEMMSYAANSSPERGGVWPAEGDGVSLGTMKLPLDTDLGRFETLLFQWANSLCQGANLPLPTPLKVDKIAGGARLGFITMEDEGKTEVSVYIDCSVFPADGPGSAPMFRAVRNGRLKDKAPPGEERIMRSLLSALQKSVEIAKVQ